MKAQIGITGFVTLFTVTDSPLRDNLQSSSQSAAHMNKFLILNCDKLFQLFKCLYIFAYL